MNTKQCKECGEEKELVKKRAICKECHLLRRKIISKKFRQNNKEKCKSSQKKYEDENKDKISIKKKEYYQKNKEEKKIKHKIYRQKNKDKTRESDRKYRQKNREAYNTNYRNRLKSDITFRLRKIISASIVIYFKKNKQSKGGKSVLKYLPYTIEELKLYLESLFEPWMNWDNHGNYNFKTWVDGDESTYTWQLDHIKPHSEFHYTSMEDEEFKQCWALSNLRPYSAKQNILDGASRIRHGNK